MHMYCTRYFTGDLKRTITTLYIHIIYNSVFSSIVMLNEQHFMRHL